MEFGVAPKLIPNEALQKRNRVRNIFRTQFSILQFLQEQFRIQHFAADLSCRWRPGLFPNLPSDP